MDDIKEARPHIRLLDGYWRVGRVPARWNKLSPRQREQWRVAHDVVARWNNQRQRDGLLPHQRKKAQQ